MEINHSNTLQKDKETRKCSNCPKEVTPFKMPQGYWYPQLCTECGAKETADREEDERREKVLQAHKRLGLSPRFARATFENFKADIQPLAHKTAVKFAEDYKPGKTSKGLYLFGHAGSGKTHLAASIGNKLFLNDGVRFVTAPELLLEIKKTFNNQYSDDHLLDRLSTSKLLIIDDLGSEKPTEWVQETLFVLIDRRYTHYLPTIFTSNYSLDQLKERLGYRIASRIAEMSEVVELKAVDYRIRKTK